MNGNACNALCKRMTYVISRRMALYVMHNVLSGSGVEISVF